MDRSQKVELLNRIKSSKAILFDLEPYILIFCNNELPENKRIYYILRDQKPCEISKKTVDQIKTTKLFLDLEDMYA